MPSIFFGTVRLQSCLLAVILIAVVSGAKFTLCGTASFFFAVRPSWADAWTICVNWLCVNHTCESFVTHMFMWIIYVNSICENWLRVNHMCESFVTHMFMWIICVNCICANWLRVNHLCPMCEFYVWIICVKWFFFLALRESYAWNDDSISDRFECRAVCCSVLQCVAVCCSVLQCVAVCCSVFNIWLFWKLSSHVSEKVFSCVVTNSLMDCTLETPMKSVKYYWNLWNMNTIWMESVKCSWNLWNTNEICEMLMKSVYATTFWTPTACWTTSSWMAIDKNNSRLLLLAWHHVTRINDVEMIISTEIVQHDVTSHISMMLQWLFRQKLYYMTSRHIYQWRHVTYMMLKKCCMLNNI